MIPLRTLTEPGTPHSTGLGGLLALVDGVERALPLERVTVRAHIAGNACRTVIDQRFRNPHDNPMEAVHLFPLPPDGAVTEVELRAGEVVVRAECREREEARQTFAEARDAGHRAALLEAERSDVHSLRVANLPPGTEVTVRIVVVERLESIDGRFRWRFPTTIPPRYLSGEPISHEGPGAVPDTDRVPDASRLQPPLRLEGGTTLDLEVQIDAPVRGLASSLHAVKMDLEAGGVTVAPSTEATLNKDFVLAFTTGDEDAQAVRAWSDGAHTLVVVEPPTVRMPTPLPRDAVFVVDISGSMNGTKMTAAKRALTAALHGLLPGDRFRIIAFDDRIEQFKPDFVAYDDRTLAGADRWIDRLAPRGGTEMLPAIQAALDGAQPEGRLRTVLFITDGQAWNEAELTAAVHNRRKRARFFTLGIDTAVNDALLKRLARVGGGTCELATPQDDIEGVVADLEARFGSPVVDDLAVEGFTAADLKRGVVFAGRPGTVLIEGAPDTVVVTGTMAEGPVRLEAEVARSTLPLGALWARERVAALEDRLALKPFEEEAIRPEMLAMALEHHIASRYTAFVAVDASVTVDGEPVVVVQPSELPEAWDAQQFAGAPAPRAARGGGPKRYRKKMAKRSAAPSAPPPMMRMASLDEEEEMAAPMGRSGGIVSSAIDALGGMFGRADREEAEAPEAAAEAMFSRDKPVRQDPASVLARSQEADGSFGGDVTRTAVALLALVLLGNTRRAGKRRRTVLKAATWLGQHLGNPVADLAMAVLDDAERGEVPAPDGDWDALLDGSAEASILKELVAASA